MKVYTAYLLIIWLSHVAALRSSLGLFDETKLQCELSSTMDGNRFSKAEVSIRTREDRKFTMQFSGTGYIEAFLECRSDGRSFALFHFVSIAGNVTCTCKARYCDSDAALIEQLLPGDSWQEVSSVKNYYDGQFEISASRTQFNSIIYRCIFPYDIKLTRREKLGLDRYMVTGCFIMLIILVLARLFKFLTCLLKKRNQPVAVST